MATYLEETQHGTIEFTIPKPIDNVEERRKVFSQIYGSAEPSDIGSYRIINAPGQAAPVQDDDMAFGEKVKEFWSQYIANPMEQAMNYGLPQVPGVGGVLKGADAMMGGNPPPPEGQNPWMSAVQGMKGGPATQAVSNFMTPKTPLEGAAQGVGMLPGVGAGVKGAQAGAKALQLIAGAGWKSALARVTSTAGVMEGAGQLQGEKTGTGAAMGLIAATLGEAGNAVIGRLASQGGPRVRKIIEHADADMFGGFLQNNKFLRRIDIDPQTGQVLRKDPLFNARDPESLHRLTVGDSRHVSENGLTILRREQDRIDRLISQRMPPEARFQGAPDAEGNPTWITYNEARDNLKLLYESAYGSKQGSPLASTFKGNAPKAEYNAAKEQFRADIGQHDPASLQLYDMSAEQFRIGREVIDIVKQGFKGKKITERPVFDSNKIRDAYEKNTLRFERKIQDPETINEFMHALWRREGSAGTRDQLDRGAVNFVRSWFTTIPQPGLTARDALRGVGVVGQKPAGIVQTPGTKGMISGGLLTGATKSGMASPMDTALGLAERVKPHVTVGEED